VSGEQLTAFLAIASQAKMYALSKDDKKDDQKYTLAWKGDRRYVTYINSMVFIIN
jgi:hypothetical protein